MSLQPLQGNNQNISPEIKFKLRELLINDEGWKRFPYVDTTGHISIGCGYNLSDRGLPDCWIGQQLNDDIDFFYKKLHDCYIWFSSLTDARKVALLNMCYNLGWIKFLSFNKMLSAIARRDYETAAVEALDSKWASQVGDRAIRIANMIREG